MKVRSLGVCAGVLAVLGMAAWAPLARSQAIAAVAPRITQAVDENNLVTLRGNTHPLARGQNDQGAVADSQPINRMLLLLQRSPDQEASLESLLDRQQTKASLGYHQWLTPQQFGQQFGPADADVQTVTSWLTSHGFEVKRVSAGRTVIEFSGNAGQVRSAFHTQIHRYIVNGQERLANATDPQIPAALASVVAGPVSIHNFSKTAQSRVRGTFSKSADTGEVKPLFTGTFQGTTYQAVGPADFNKIYTVPPSATGANQTIAIVGDSDICTAGSPDYATACNSADDVALFRTAFALTPSAPNVTVIVDGPNPGLNTDETEGDLDVEWSSAVAPSAAVDFVIAETTESTAGTDLAAEYIVDNNLAPVLSESFGFCEAGLGQANNAFENDLWEQAAAQGITVVVSAGDSGSAGCDDENTESFADAVGASVNGIASTPFNVAAGGTDFDVTATGYPGSYWTTANSVAGTSGLSAKSYIPETTWNDSCAQNFTGSLTSCSPPSNLNSLNIVAGGGGQSNCINPVYNGFGDFTGCGVISTTSTLTGYPKPSWQGGAYITGLASTDAVRNIPDISLFAADGLVSNSFYIVCETDLGATCVSKFSAIRGPFSFLAVGGTSSSAPTFAGIMALVNQSTGVRQGNANYVLYPLATKQQQSNANCNSSTGPNNGTAACTFNDVTKGNNSVPCIGEGPDCSNQTNPDLYGVVETGSLVTFLPNGTLAFNTGTGYDLATGLGTINVNNLLTNWSSVSFTGTTTTLCMTAPPATTCTTAPVTITHGTSVSVTVGVTPSPGTNSASKPEVVSLIGTGSFGTSSTAGVDRFTSNNYVVSNDDLYALTNGAVTAPTTALVGGTYTVQARYAGDGTNGASTSASPGISVTVSPEPSATTVNAGILYLASGDSGNISGETVYYGDAIALRADVVGKTSGLESLTGSVTFTDNNTPIGTFALNTEGYAEDQTGSDIVGVSNIAALPVGTHVIQATYSGDASYCPSPTVAACVAGTSTVGTSASFSVVAAPTTTTVEAFTSAISEAGSITVPSGTSVTLQAFVDTLSNSALSSGGSSGSFLTGTVTFSLTPAGGVATAQPPVSIASNVNTYDSSNFVAGVATLNFTPTVTTTVTATFTPTGGNYGASTTLSTTTVNVSTASFTLAPLPSTSNPPAANDTITINAGQSGSLPITVTSNTFNGNVALTCSVAPQILTTVTDPPVCSFTLSGAANSTIALNPTTNPAVTSGTRQLVITTTAASGLGAPMQAPQGVGPTWIVAGSWVAFGGLFLLWTVFPVRRLRGAMLLASLILLVAGTTISCGGGPVSSSSSGGAGSSAGTTVTSYTVTVTATPSGGAAQQTFVQLFVN